MTMQTKEFDYPALLVRQGPESPPLVLFSASAVDINRWVGIPQKSRILEDGETMGFQRDDNEDRIKEIAQFYQNPHNVIHNPLLCAIRKAHGVEVSFVPAEGDDMHGQNCPGTLKIALTDRTEQPLSQLFRDARLALEERIPDLASLELSNEKYTAIRERSDLAIPTEDVEEEDPDDVSDDSGDVTGLPEEALFEESHVTEFWSDLKAREIILEQVPDFEEDEFVGFSRDAVDSLLRPIVLVDGQHRLLGALKAASDSVDPMSDAYLKHAAELLKSEPSRQKVHDAIIAEKARKLPISLLLDEKPGEHVFQFVIVNQKATPVRPALLGTIISTSLSEDELAPISDRLERAGVELESARSATFFAKNSQSPFAGLVSRGFEDSPTDLLQWSVLLALIKMFRDLRGAKFYHQTSSRLDFARAWARWGLRESKIIEPASNDLTEILAVWGQSGGPWRDVFLAFWTAVRDRLADTGNPSSPSYWGHPRTSNLFNKPMLMTLATDFFSYMNDTSITIQKADDVKDVVDRWLAMSRRTISHATGSLPE